ncbi:hypothetical protein SPRG_05668, partial [Saprolegnia parasitica CBS 223.65]
MHPSKNVHAPEVGGAIYSLFRQNARYKQSPTISFRSADCFVYCYKDGMLVERIRLSLLESLDRNASTPSLAVVLETEPSSNPYSFNTLVDAVPPRMFEAPSHARGVFEVQARRRRAPPRTRLQLPTRHLGVEEDFYEAPAAVAAAAELRLPDAILPKYADFVYQVMLRA